MTPAPFTRALLALVLACPWAAAAQQDDAAASRKELDAARADLQRAAKRVAELSRASAAGAKPLEIEHLTVRKPRLGVLLARDDSAGVRITGITPDSGAAKAGVKAGDRLLRIGGKPITGTDGEQRLAHARTALAELKADTPVVLTLRRDGREQEVRVTPSPVAPHIAFDALNGPGTFTLLQRAEGMPGIEGVPLPMDELRSVISPELRRELGRLGTLEECEGGDCRLPALAQALRWSNLNLASVDASLGRYFGTDAGVLVLSVGEELAGLQPGDVIRKLDGTPVTTPRDVTRALREKREDARVTVEYLRDRQTRTSTVSVPKAAAFRFPATSRVMVKPRVAEAAGQAPTVVERRRVMIIDQDGKVQTFEDAGSDAPPPPAQPSGKGGALR